MYEYVACQAAAWEAPVSLRARLDQLQTHPRTQDNLEIMRRWEEARLKSFLSEKQKDMIKSDPDQEYILIIDETGRFELQPYEQIQDVAQGNSDIEAFIFSRKGKNYVVYWHKTGEGKLSLRIDPDKIKLYKQLGETIPFEHTEDGLVIPVADRLYLEVEYNMKTVIQVFREAELL